MYFSANPNNEIEFFGQTLAIGYPNGEILWVPPCHFKATCLMDLTYWPYDIHHCSAKFGSWIYSGFELDLVFQDNKPMVRA